MSVQSQLIEGFRKIIERAGTPIRLQYFTISIGSIYSDDVTLTQSGGDLWTSGVHFPLNNQPGHSDSILLEQGQLINGDSKLFVHGSLLITGSELQVKITIGSPHNVDRNYTLIFPGATSWSVSNTPIYKVVYLRQIGQTGSFLGEA